MTLSLLRAAADGNVARAAPKSIFKPALSIFLYFNRRERKTVLDRQENKVALNIISDFKVT